MYNGRVQTMETRAFLLIGGRKVTYSSLKLSAGHTIGTVDDGVKEIKKNETP